MLETNLFDEPWRLDIKCRFKQLILPTVRFVCRYCQFLLVLK
jgi:hypothetical protein